MKWNSSNELKALLGILAQHNKFTFDADKISENWPADSDGENPTPRAIREHVSLLKKRAKTYFGDTGGITANIPTPLLAPVKIEPATPITGRDGSSLSTSAALEVIDMTITPREETQRSKVLPTPPTSQISKPAKASRKRKADDTSSDDEIDDPYCASEKGQPQTSTTRSNPMNLRAKTRRAYAIEGIKPMSISHVDNDDSDDSDETFNLVKFRQQQEKEVARGKKRRRWASRASGDTGSLYESDSTPSSRSTSTSASDSAYDTGLDPVADLAQESTSEDESDPGSDSDSLSKWLQKVEHVKKPPQSLQPLQHPRTGMNDPRLHYVRSVTIIQSVEADDDD